MSLHIKKRGSPATHKVTTRWLLGCFVGVALNRRRLPLRIYNRNLLDNNSFCGTSIGGNFNCSPVPICASSFR
jgi:hypothetical protein